MGISCDGLPPHVTRGGVATIRLALLAWALLAAVAATGGMVETVDRRVYDGEVTLAEGGRLRVRLTNGAVQELALDRVRIARFREASAADGPLPRGWQAEDIGQLQGNSGEKEGVYALALPGGALKDPKQPSAHFVQRILRGDGEVVARVLSVSGAESCVAGVMMRENLDPAGGFILLGVTPQQRLRLDFRELGWHPLFRRDLGPVTLPVWLKLARRESDKQVTAFRSAGGDHWEKVSDRSLGCPTEQFPAGSDYWHAKAHLGVALASTNAGATAQARLDLVTVTARGLLGEYYGEDGFRKVRFARPDGKVDFNWGLGSPAPDIEPDHFSVRWTGQIEPKFSDDYLFHLDADNDGWLWINGQEISTARFKKSSQGKPVPLQAGKKYELKLDYKEGAGEASVRLGWSSPHQPLEVIPASQLSYAYHARSPNENGDPDDTVTNAALAKGVWLRHGSFLAGPVRTADESTVRLVFAGQKEFPVHHAKVMQVVFRTPPKAGWAAAAKGRAGLLLANGDFLETELVKIEKGVLTVRSILFGQRTYSLERGEVTALMLRPASPAPARFEVRLANRSVLRAQGLRPLGQTVLVDDTTLGEVAIPETELLEIRAAR
jgi:hypothetical protein